MPAIVVTAHADEQWVDKARQAGIFSYLLKPITERDLGPAIAVAWRQWEQFQALRQEAEGLRVALEDRKVIERAKGIVMRRLGVPEAEAYRRLRRYSSDHNKKLSEVAQQVIGAEAVFEELDPG